jgi:hypothetical protein
VLDKPDRSAHHSQRRARVSLLLALALATLPYAGARGAPRPSYHRRIFGLRLLASATVTDAWVRDQLATANDRFADVGIGFQLLGRETLPPDFDRIDSPGERDRVGRAAVHKGEILWIAPQRLIDLDGHSKRRGVHWRDRADPRGEDVRRRWVIVAADAFPLVLAHELGHFFGLPHGSERTSFMNKRDAPGRPLWTDRRLTSRERRRVVARAAAMQRNGRLRRLQAVN